MNSESQLLRSIKFRGIILQCCDLLKIILPRVSWDNDFRSNLSDSAILMFLIHSKCCLTLPSLSSLKTVWNSILFSLLDVSPYSFQKETRKKIELFCPSTCLSAFLPSPFSDSFQYLYYAFSSQYNFKKSVSLLSQTAPWQSVILAPFVILYSLKIPIYINH